MTEIKLVNGESIVVSEEIDLIKTKLSSFGNQSLAFITGTMKGELVIINISNILYFVKKEEKKGLTAKDVAVRI